MGLDGMDNDDEEDDYNDRDDDDAKNEKPESNHSWLEKPLPWQLSLALQDQSSVITGTPGPTHTEQLSL